MKNGMIRIGMFEAYLERMLIRGLKVAYISSAPYICTYILHGTGIFLCGWAVDGPGGSEHL